MNLPILLLFFLLFLIFLKNKENFEDENDKLPKKVFTYSLDDTPKNYIENLKITFPTHWEIIEINEKNLDKYVEKDFIKKYRKLEKEKFIYLICIKALLNYGGIFIDPTIIINDGSIFDRYQIEDLYEGYDSSLVELVNNKNINYLKSYIIMGTKESKFINNLLINLTNNFNMNVKEFINKQIPKNIIIKNIPNKKSETRFKIFFTIFLLLKEKNKYKIDTKNEFNKKIYGINLAQSSKRDALNKIFLNYIFSKPFFS